MTHIIQYTHVTPSQHEAGEGRGQEGDYNTHYTVHTRNTVPVGWALLAVKIEISMNRLATFHKVGPGRGEHDGEKSFRIGSLICPAVRARSYA